MTKWKMRKKWIQRQNQTKPFGNDGENVHNQQPNKKNC